MLKSWMPRGRLTTATTAAIRFGTFEGGWKRPDRCSRCCPCDCAPASSLRDARGWKASSRDRAPTSHILAIIRTHGLASDADSPQVQYFHFLPSTHAFPKQTCLTFSQAPMLPSTAFGSTRRSSIPHLHSQPASGQRSTLLRSCVQMPRQAHRSGRHR